MSRQNFVVASSYLVKQIVRACTENQLGTWPTVGWKSRFKLILLRAVCDKHSLFFASEGCRIYTWLKQNLLEIPLHLKKKIRGVVMGGDGLSKLKQSQEGEMMQAAWELFLKLCWALSEVRVSRYSKPINLKNVTCWSSRIKEALGNKDMFFEKSCLLWRMNKEIEAKWM